MKFSIVTPSYNQARYLQANIDSVAAQSGVEVEHIIIDGGSSDNSKDIIQANEDRLAFWVSEKDKGQTDAINKGLRKATGDIITWINSDDQLIPDCLIKMKKHFEDNPGIGLIHGKTILFKEGGFEKESAGNYLNGLPQAYLSGMPFAQPSSFFTRKALDTVGLPDESLHFGMDYDLFLRMSLHFEFIQVDDLFSKYLLHDESKSVTSQVKFANEWAGIFSKLLRSFEYSEDIIKEMKSIGLYKEGTDNYQYSKPFTKEDLQKAFLFHLAFQLTFRYEALDIQACKSICKYLITSHTDFVDENGLRPICKRVRLGKTVIRTLRKLKS